ncbi:DUF484 family protein [Psychrosphaera aquimarina]|uniref:DUF484 family protein n=1 Tax=Psychrosphaera aquimarina TaxID=2044854 RepID=A0ABU3QZG3_9GAMM|nr:DUF484 family protein [Psychrosphaera aquimarina]MDU0112535.1 DUF484 family protein [Psychrosphaera aquimarina]
MTKVLIPNPEDLELDAELVKDYLEQNPSFFVDHPELVTQLRIPHVAHGATSLLERRQEIQRDKILQMEEELNVLMVNARQNENIFRAISEMYIGLVGCVSVAELEKVVDRVCKDQLFLAQFRLLQPEDEAYIHLQAKLDGNPSYLGRLYPEIMETVFDNFAQSVALVELNYMVGEEETIFGIAAFASGSIHHFQPHMDTLFINQLGRLLSRHAVHLTC